ncbi:cytochrome b [Pelagibacterium halotolerans]|uniref:cytochrome b n=1 Tax=Pelagibacterium halotolerans TaxID=531813 RepID=UPI00384F5DA6
MSTRSTANRYGTVAITIHWVTAVAVLGILISGFQAAGIENEANKRALLAIHAGMGASIVLLTVLRIAWWRFGDSKPASAPAPKWQQMAASAMHVLLYVIILGMGASGIGMLVLSGAGAVLFLGVQDPLPDFWDYLPRIPHGIGARLLIALALVHIGAALYHQFAMKDGLMARMGLGTEKRR